MNPTQKQIIYDNDYEWLQGHLKAGTCLKPREELAAKVGDFIESRISSGSLPYTIGVFGGWGSGKTTFLALLAKRLEETANCRVIYFNAWKYAGFMEIVPSLIHKILHYGVAGTRDRLDATMRVLLCLGKEHADAFGEWTKDWIGVDPVKLFKDVYGEFTKADDAAQLVSPKVLDAYYTQVDKAQDTLEQVLGKVRAGETPKNSVIVLIDELDRCDPDEAFNVIKQIRVLFAMRSLPVAFVLCANPEPIGLAIKHRYGLESDAGDYEARRILEKFVDSYEDLSGPVSLEPLVRSLWKSGFRESKPWVLALDEAQDGPEYGIDVVRNATGFDAMTTAIPLYSNLRVLFKSFTYVYDRAKVNRHLLWTIWHLEIVSQIDPRFRSDLKILAGELESLIVYTYSSLAEVHFTIEGSGRKKRLNYTTDKGRTTFAVFRSYFWEHAKAKLNELSKAVDPESGKRAEVLRSLIEDSRRIDFVILLCMLPFESAPRPEELLRSGGTGPRDNPFAQDFGLGLHHQFAYLLANY